MSDKFTTSDCKKAIEEFFKYNNKACPGEFKRTKKFKDSQENWVRVFEHKDSGTILKVREVADNLQVVFANDQVGKGYVFMIGEDETYGAESGNVCFYVCNKEFYEQNGHIDSVQFTSQFEMPAHMEEIQESCFLVEESSLNQVRKELLEMGFTEARFTNN